MIYTTIHGSTVCTIWTELLPTHKLIEKNVATITLYAHLKQALVQSTLTWKPLVL